MMGCSAWILRTGRRPQKHYLLPVVLFQQLLVLVPVSGWFGVPGFAVCMGGC